MIYSDLLCVCVLGGGGYIQRDSKAFFQVFWGEVISDL